MMFEVFEKYNKINNKVLKFNLKNACASRYLKYGGRVRMAEFLDMDINKFQSCISPSHCGLLTLENLLIFMSKLDIKPDELFKDVPITKSNCGVSKTWTTEKKGKFLSDLKSNGLKYVSKTYNLSEKTSMLYAKRFEEGN